ncbi:sulfotransferase domain-containing protein [Longimicrobium sp.]|uniref:sulfotransferase domain-containing protein n=1 Tax=Longimicrobium sp. TaxID=2029185 RepID=UPI003B3AC214
MYRKRPRKTLGALAGSMMSLAVRIDHAVLMRCQMKLRDLHRRLTVLRYGLEYDGSEDDIFIVTYPKSGTTWLQMIVYQLTTDGEMNFAHIEDVSPFLEIAMIPRGQKIQDLPATPRVVKSHLSYHEIPKGPGRYIYGVRNGLDVGVSYHYHARKYLPGLGNSTNEFFGRFAAGGVPYGSWFDHVSGWLRNKDHLNVLVVTYEELSADLESAVKRIADFCGITIDPAAMPRILERCSFAFMREHDEKFSFERMRPKPPAAPETAFIRQGKVGGWREELDPRAVSEFQEACDRQLRDFGEDMFRVLSGRGGREGKPASPPPPAGGLSPAGQPGGASHRGA